MQEGGAGEPWHQRRIFDGIPSPVASPAEDGVGPMRAEKNSAGEKSPGDHGPAAGGVDPFLAGGFYNKRPHRAGRRHREAHASAGKHRGMEEPLPTLEQRDAPGARGG